jgi:transposase-like protein
MKAYMKGFKSSTTERLNRRFSEEFKLKKVKELESGKTTVRDICRSYEVTDSAVYHWLTKYSKKDKPERTIVESKSDTKKIVALQKRIAELERLLGQKQIEIEFKDKMIEIAEQAYGVDIKKKFDTKQ